MQFISKRDLPVSLGNKSVMPAADEDVFALIGFGTEAVAYGSSLSTLFTL